MNANLLRYSVLGAAVISTCAGAVGFGDLTLHSRIGESLRAEVPLIGGRGEIIDTACFTLAPLASADLPVITGARVRLLRDASGYRLMITGNKPVAEPIFLISLRANCGIDLQRDYVLMPDLPPSLADTPQTAEARPAAASATKPGSRTWRASEGETLASIAESLAGGDLAQQRRTLSTLRRANPELDAETPLPEGASVRLASPKRPGSKTANGAQATRPAQPTPRSDAPSPAERAPNAPPSGSEPAGDRLVLGAAPDEVKPGEKGVPARGSISEMEERMLKLESTLNSLNQEIDKLNTALALTTEALAAQNKLQQAQSAQPAAVAAPPQASSTQGSWLELLFSALAGGTIAAGLASWLGRKRQPTGQAELPLAISGYRPEIQVAPLAPPPATDSSEPEIEIENLELSPRTETSAVDILLSDFSTPPTDAQAAEVDLNESDAALELAEIMLSFGRIRGAAETLAQYIDENASDNVQPWIMLLDLYRRGDMRNEFEALLPKARAKFNLHLPAWDDSTTPISGLKSLEDYAHLIAHIAGDWGKQACMDYLHEIIVDNRAGQRDGFPIEVVEEVVLLMRVLESAYGLKRAA